MLSKKISSALVELARLPDTNRDLWLEGATKSVEFLERNYREDDEILLYAYGPHFWVHSVLARNAAIDPPDHEDLSNARIVPDDAWRIQRSYGGGEGHRVYLEPPLSHPGCKSLVGGEKLAFIRDFEGMKSYEPQVEINQKLIHSLDLHFVDERQAYCRLDKRGDIEDVISLFADKSSDPWKNIRVVSIKRRHLDTYMALTEMSLVGKFDFTRFIPGEFSSWDNADEKNNEADNLFFRYGAVLSHASYANGHILLPTCLTVEDLIDEWKAEEDRSNRQYATFKIIDRKNRKRVETPCSPHHIVNYFTESDLPWEISPAFFSPEVLHKYKADREKYTVEDHSIRCRNAWFLKTYDFNEAGQVHTYVGDLADLPYEEQLYWQSFNEWPKDGISKRAFQTDILGQFPEEVDPLFELKEQARNLDHSRPSWWKPRGEEIIDKVLYPATDSVEEWGDAVLALDHSVVEGFLDKPLRAIIEDNDGKYEKDWRSLKLLEVCLSKTGLTEERAKKVVEPLRELHNLRNPARAHGDPEGKAKAVASARKQHHTLRNHFEDLVARIRDAMDQIIATLPKP